MECVEISVVSPVYRGEAFVHELVSRCESTLKRICTSYEIILVEDNSPDNSWKEISKVCSENNSVVGIKLSRNFGQQYAIQAGLDASKGEFVVTLDCDLQDRPEEILTLFNRAQEGFDIVFASRESRKDGYVKRFASVLFYQLMSYLTEVEQDPSIANFVLYRRAAIKALSMVGDSKRYYPILPQLIGFRQSKVSVEHAERPEGQSSYTIKARIKLAIDTILNFSDKPLRLSVGFGVVLSVGSLVLSMVSVWFYVSGKIDVAGWTSLALLISFFSGAIISVLGMVGLYVGQIFETVKKRPTYFILERKN